VLLGLFPSLPPSDLPIVVPFAALKVELAPAVPLALPPPAPPAVPTTRAYACPLAATKSVNFAYEAPPPPEPPRVALPPPPPPPPPQIWI